VIAGIASDAVFVHDTAMRFSREVEELIANLRGIPMDEDLSPRGIVPLSSALQVILEQYRIGQKTPQMELMEHWKDIMGEEAAQRCAPARFSNQGTHLTILVHNATLCQELQFQKPEILRRIRTLPTCQTVKRLTFRNG